MGDIGLWRQGWNWARSRKGAFGGGGGGARSGEKFEFSVDRHWPVVSRGCVALGRLLLMVLAYWRNCAFEGVRSLAGLGSTAVFVVAWSGFLSLTSTSCLVYVLLSLVATFIVQKILLDDVGLRYICATAERFFALGSVLGNMVVTLADQPSARLLKHIIRCYLRLSDNPRACEALQTCLPEMLKDGTFNNCLRDDPATRRWLQQLLHNVTTGGMVAGLQAGVLDHMMGN